MPLSFVVFAFFLVFCAIIAVKMHREWQAATNNLPRKLAICIFYACILAFLEPMWIGFFPSKLLDHVELPNAPLGDRLIAPDGRVFIVSSPIARVQRYGPEGFELGFMYGSKASKFWMSPSGNVLICTMGGALLTYSPDGTEVPPRGSCNDRFEANFSSSPSHAKVPTIAFNWFSALAVPLWHPVAAWLTALLTGLFSLAFSRRPTS
jgi:hypothetical protein